MLFYIIVLFILYKFILKEYIFKSKKINPKEKRILVTGAANGIGKKICEELLLNECFVYATDINESALESAFENNKFKANVKCLKLDVTNQDNINQVFEEIKNDGKGLFGLVNNAGVSKYPGSKQHLIKLCCEYDVDKEVLPVIDVNLVGLIRMTTKIIPLLLETNFKNEQPCIINIASVAGILGATGLGIYSSTKFAVVGYSDVLRKEIGDKIRISCIEPGFVNTQMVQSELLDNFSYNKDTLFPNRYEKFEQSIKKAKQYKKYWAMNPRIISRTVFRELFQNPCNPHVIADNWWMRYMWHFVRYVPTTVQDYLMNKIL